MHGYKKEMQMKYYRPIIGEKIHKKFLKFVLQKHGTTRAKANQELETAIDEYLENHGREISAVE